MTLATDGTQRALLESYLQSAILAVYTQGGEGETIMCGPAQKQKLSALARVTSSSDARRVNEDASSMTYTNAWDVYKSDFGTHNVIPNRFQRNRTMFVLSKEYWRLDFFRGYRSHKLAKTGDSEKWQLLCEYTSARGRFRSEPGFRWDV